MFQCSEPQTGGRTRWLAGTYCLPIRLARIFAFENIPYTTKTYYSDATGRLEALAADLVENVSTVDERRIMKVRDRREWGRGRLQRL
jgi:hypothetical protein